MSKSHLKITLIRSKAGRNPIHTKTLKGLGLHKIGRSVLLANTPAILGMANQVAYLINIEEV